VCAVFLVGLATLAPPALLGQEAEEEGEVQDDESKALDSTATQWSFQFAWQNMDYHEDQLSDGSTRNPGANDYLQLRIVAPIPLKSLTILPRLTVRHYEVPVFDSAGSQTGTAAGLGNTELFALIIPRSWDWGTGRVGLGPLVTFPGNPDVARDEWGYGLAGAVVNASGRWFYGVLLTQSWRAIEPTALPTGTSDANALGISPFLNYRLGNGWYVGNGDMVARYDWDSGQLYVPIGVRLGKVFVQEKGSWNFYAEYQTSLIYKDYPGPAAKNSIRINATYTVPVG
jgi:hypothetical protein